MQKILAIETSCDETAAAVVGINGAVFSNIISSQIKVHSDYGGVIPEIASRMHVEAINIVIGQALHEAQVTIKDISAIAVTQGPGLLGALMIGLQAAKTLSFIHNIPLIAVNHMAGHVFANFIGKGEWQVQYPFLCLVVSGGHTMLVIAHSDKQFETIGRTSDDAAGESYDKVARLLKLGYPGGPVVDKMAQLGDPNKIKFMRAKTVNAAGPFDFSFSGLKTAVINYYRKFPESDPADMCAAFQQTVIQELVAKTMAAVAEYKLPHLYMAGGVAANKSLRKAMTLAAEKSGVHFSVPDFIFCTDNAAMIAGAAIPKFLRQEFSDLNIKADPSLRLSNI